jgi:hypothetical protein
MAGEGMGNRCLLPSAALVELRKLLPRPTWRVNPGMSSAEAAGGPPKDWPGAADCRVEGTAGNAAKISFCRFGDL